LQAHQQLHQTLYKLPIYWLPMTDFSEEASTAASIQASYAINQHLGLLSQHGAQLLPCTPVHADKSLLLF
jgi:ornithine carbamoyltransferase